MESVANLTPCSILLKNHSDNDVQNSAMEQCENHDPSTITDGMTYRSLDLQVLNRVNAGACVGGKFLENILDVR